MGWFSSAKGSIGNWQPTKTASEIFKNPANGISDAWKGGPGQAWNNVVRDPIAGAMGGGGGSGALSAEDMAGIQSQYAKPVRPEYQSALDPATGQLKSGYEVSAGKASFTAPKMSDMEAATKMKNIGMGNEQSPWLKLQLQQNELDKNAALNAASGQLGGANAAARGALAMRGGMTSGARERLARGGQSDYMRSTQNIYGQQAQSNLGAQIQAGKDSQSMLQGAAGMEADLGKFGASGNFEADKFNQNQNLAAQQFNVGNKFGQLGGINQSNYQYYTEDMKDRAANIMAEVMGRTGGGGGGGWLGKLGIG